MKDKHKSAYAKKAAKARGRRRAAAPAKSLKLKSYSFQFKLSAQCLVSGGGAGSLSLTGGAPTFQNPLTAGNFAMYASTNGLPSYWDCAIGVPFKLSDLNSLAVYQSMFDQYKIRRVTCHIEYLNNVSAANATGLMPTLYTYHDLDDAVIPASLTQISGKQGVKIRQFGNKATTSYKFSIKPVTTTVVQVVNGGVTASAINKKSQWLDCVDSSVQHNAMKMFITDIYLPGSAAVTQAFRFNWTYDISFQNPLVTS